MPYLALLLLLLCAPLQAQNLVVSRVVSIYDADTFRVDINGWPPIIGSNMPIRVLG
ncbi:MAG TPA: thermonuclease family protein, partial [Candidatus Tenderia sp.]|nr:thermonuclease family protein [Candidatus Tenderia sp.]